VADEGRIDGPQEGHDHRLRRETPKWIWRSS